jgi:hypothetical protein
VLSTVDAAPTNSAVYSFQNHPEIGWYAALSKIQENVSQVYVPTAGTTIWATFTNPSSSVIFSWPVNGTFQFPTPGLTPTTGSLSMLTGNTYKIITKEAPGSGCETTNSCTTGENTCTVAVACDIGFQPSSLPATGTYTVTSGYGQLFIQYNSSWAQSISRLESNTTNPSRTGIMRLAHSDQIRYRNGAVSGGTDATAFGGWAGSGDQTRLQVGDSSTGGVVIPANTEIQGTLNLSSASAPQQYNTNTLGNALVPCGTGVSSWGFAQTTGYFNICENGGSFYRVQPLLSSYTTIVELFGSGSCSGFLKNDGTCTSTVPAATNIAGGTTNSIPYQQAPDTTVFVGANSSLLDEVFTQTNNSPPNWLNNPALSAANFTNFPTLNQSTTGNAATATALAATPTLCSSNFAPTGITTTGNATGCFQPGTAAYYSTIPAAQTGTYGPITMASSLSGTHMWLYNFTISLSSVGVGCTGNTTLVPTMVWTDPNSSSTSTQTFSTLTLANSGNGTLGYIGSSNFNFTSKSSTTITYTFTYTAGAGCSTNPGYRIYPALVQQL